MKRVGISKKVKAPTNTLRVATSVPSVNIRFHTGLTSTAERRYIGDATSPKKPVCEASGAEIFDSLCNEEPSLPFLNAHDDAPGAVPAYKATTACDQKGEKKSKEMRECVAHMNELREKKPTFVRILLSRYHHSQLLTACSCYST
ncbi:hypothetical protein C8F04DRAFT_1266137 [Mycena alexandri]|uniref:Uncharacterized protein n=1 Tax=Mycena alexandri TaxID=1745969 RepID=A0AAD6WXG5_9AGAR|nr:hypothetical protein C8F04DRAFT_1266137 [Mycena alexandri]